MGCRGGVPWGVEAGSHGAYVVSSWHFLQPPKLHCLLEPPAVGMALHVGFSIFLHPPRAGAGGGEVSTVAATRAAARAASEQPG
jgi:hypothetical protein